MRTIKTAVDELAILGGNPIFQMPKSTSNLVRPDFGNFLNYSKIFFEARQYTNNGPLIRQLEARLAKFHQTDYCVTFCSGFWALALAIKTLATPGKREVIMPSLTYRRMADIASWTGLEPHFCEVDPDTLANNATTVRSCINVRTALILGVHPIVGLCDIDGLTALAHEKNIPLLFDAVESACESHMNRRIGSFGNAEIFSLGASKLLNGFEGGYLTTNDGQLAEQLALCRGFGFKGPDNVALPHGMNAKLNEIHAAMALASLDDLEDQVARNRRRYQLYQQHLASLPGIRLLEFDDSQQPGYKNILAEVLEDWPLSRETTIRVLNAERILARAYYSPPLHHKKTAYPAIVPKLPVTDRLSRRFISLPAGHLVDETDIIAITEFMHYIHDHADVISNRLPQDASR